MKKNLLILIILCFSLNISVNALNISSKSAIVLDNDSGRILYEKDINTQRLIASTTKIMTCIIALENSDLNKIVTVGEEINDMYGTSAYLDVGEEITIKDLLYGLMLRSGNDASVVIAKNVGGGIDKFVEMMNKKAKEIGMNNTIYNNPHGLDEQTKNYSTAYDLALLSKYASKNKEYLKITSTKKYKTSSNKKSFLWSNRNNLIRYKYFKSGKTGYTPSAGKTIVSSSFNDLDLSVVLLNDGNIYDSSEQLYNYYFKKYKRYKILDKNNFSINNKLYDKKIYIKNSFYYPLNEEEKDNIKIIVYINNKSNNNEIGDVIVELDNKEIYKEKIYIKKNKKSFFKKFFNL